MKLSFNILFLFLFSVINLQASRTLIRVEQYTTEDGLAHRAISGMHQDRYGLMWFATWNGLCSFDGNKFKSYKHNDNNSNSRIDKIWELENGKFVCKIYNESIMLFDPVMEEFSVYTNDNLLPTKISSLYRLTYEEGSLKFHNVKTDSVYYYPIENKGIHLGVHCYFVDRQENVWVNFNDRLYKFSFVPVRYEYKTFVDDAGTEKFRMEIRSLYKDKYSRLWVGSKMKRLFVYDESGAYVGNMDESGNIVKHPVEMPDNIYNIFEARNGDIWLATRGSGVMRLIPTGSPISYRVEKYSNDPGNLNSIGNDNVYSFAEDHKGRIWIGTYGGGVSIATVRPDRSVQIRDVDRRSILQEKKYGIRVRHLCAISDKYMAASTTIGVLIYDMDGNCVQKVGTNNAMSVSVMKDSAILVATLGNGLNRIVKSEPEWRIERVSASGLPDVINWVKEEEDGSRWIFSDNMLLQYFPKEDSYIKYSSEFFNMNMSFSEGSPLLTSDGDLIIGESNGIVKVSCHAMEKSSYVPPILLTELKIDGRAVPHSLLTDSVETINLKSAQRNVKLEFSTLDYNNASNIYYAYRLEGRDSAWIYTKNNRIVSLDNLSAGRYKLYVKSTNSDRLWIDNTRVFNIAVARSYWSFLRIMLVFICIVATGVCLYLYLRLKKQKRVVEIVEIKPGKPELEPEQPEIVCQNEVFVTRVMEFMEANMDNSTLGVEDFASHLGCSRSRFYRQMKDTLDIKPVDFIREMRIKRAVYLLESRQYNISEVAFMTGFSDSKYFSKVFKKEKGQTPSEYISQL